MGRIRTIKPEFPQSESVGNLSRDARLLFVQLFTIADDEGRLRAASRMLASLLYPYDDDAGGLIDRWLDELERKGMVRRYVVEGSTYLEIVKWLDHQKIDKPSKSRLPAFVDGSRSLANAREGSSADMDLVSRTMDHGGVVERARTPAEALGLVDDDLPVPTRGKLISDEAFLVAAEVVLLTGRHEHDPICVGAPLTVQGWFNAGWNAECIKVGVQRGMASRNGDAPSTLKYFEKAIARAHAELTPSVPVATITEGEKFNVQSSNGRGRSESLSDIARRQADAGIAFGPRPTLRAVGGDEAGGPVVRLLPES